MISEHLWTDDQQNNNSGWQFSWYQHHCNNKGASASSSGKKNSLDMEYEMEDMAEEILLGQGPARKKGMVVYRPKENGVVSTSEFDPLMMSSQDRAAFSKQNPSSDLIEPPPSYDTAIQYRSVKM